MLRGMQKFKMSTGLKAHTGFDAYLSPTLNFASDWGPVSFREAPQHVCSSRGSCPQTQMHPSSSAFAAAYMVRGFSEGHWPPIRSKIEKTAWLKNGQRI